MMKHYSRGTKIHPYKVFFLDAVKETLPTLYRDTILSRISLCFILILGSCSSAGYAENIDLEKIAAPTATVHEPKARGPHSLGIGAPYGGMGYRYTAQGNQRNWFATVSVLLGLNAGLEIPLQSKENQSIELHAGTLIIYNDMLNAGLAWNWYENGASKRGWRLGLGLNYISKNESESCDLNCLDPLEKGFHPSLSLSFHY